MWLSGWSWCHCSVLFFSHPRSEGWPHHGRTFSIYLCLLSFWLTLPRRVLSTSCKCPSVLWHCWLGVRKSIRPVKTEWLIVSVVIWLDWGADCLHIVQLMPLPSQNPIIYCTIKIQMCFGFTFLLLAGSSKKEANKWDGVVVIALTELWAFEHFPFLRMLRSTDTVVKVKLLNWFTILYLHLCTYSQPHGLDQGHQKLLEAYITHTGWCIVTYHVIIGNWQKDVC